MDLGTMTTKLRQAIGNPSSGDVTDNTLYELLNDSYAEIGDKYRFFKARKVCTFATVNGTSAYTLPTTNVELIRVYDITNSRTMTMIGDDEAQIYRMTESDTSTHGFPTYYTHYRDWIRFIPVPNGAYTMEIYYRIMMTALVNPIDIPIFPDAWHTGIVRLARYNYYEFVKNDAPKAIGAMNSYKLWLQDKPNEVDEELAHKTRGVIVPTLAGVEDGERVDFDHGD